MNLVLNAVEAMSSVEDSARKLLITTKQAPNNDVLVAVHDSGPGIDAEKIEQVFAPFYTTRKRYGNGTLDLPVHHSRPWRPVVGRGESTRGRGVSVHSAAGHKFMNSTQAAKQA